jgi:hypothetical protein
MELMALCRGKVLSIMYYGAKECRNPAFVIPIFQASGVLQWICFFNI